MKRLLAFFAGGFGLGALFGRRSRHAPLPLGASPAEELRQRLADARATGPEPAAEPAADAEPEPAEPAPAEIEAPAERLSVEERRAVAHDRARDAIDKLGSD